MNAVLDNNWIKTPSAKEYIDSLFHHNKRRQFGLIERPSLAPNKSLNIVKYKIFVCGKTNVGKSALISRLAGCKASEPGSENAGITTTMIYWPVRLNSTGQIMFFQLSFWDVAENTLKKFDHIQPACRSDADCILFAFSLTDRASFVEISTLLNQLDDCDNKNPVLVVAATKTDQYMYSDISDKEIDQLSQTRNVPILRTNFSNPQCSIGDRDSIFEISPFLNQLSGLLFHRDYLLARNM